MFCSFGGILFLLWFVMFYPSSGGRDVWPVAPHQASERWHVGLGRPLRGLGESWWPGDIWEPGFISRKLLRSLQFMIVCWVYKIRSGYDNCYSSPWSIQEAQKNESGWSNLKSGSSIECESNLKELRCPADGANLVEQALEAISFLISDQFFAIACFCLDIKTFWCSYCDVQQKKCMRCSSRKAPKRFVQGDMGTFVLDFGFFFFWLWLRSWQRWQVQASLFMLTEDRCSGAVLADWWYVLCFLRQKLATGHCRFPTSQTIDDFSRASLGSRQGCGDTNLVEPCWNRKTSKPFPCQSSNGKTWKRKNIQIQDQQPLMPRMTCEAIQCFGRVHRANQLVPPKFLVLTTSHRHVFPDLADPKLWDAEATGRRSPLQQCHCEAHRRALESLYNQLELIYFGMWKVMSCGAEDVLGQLGMLVPRYWVPELSLLTWSINTGWPRRRMKLLGAVTKGDRMTSMGRARRLRKDLDTDRNHHKIKAKWKQQRNPIS